jgi:hypothetical protein
VARDDEKATAFLDHYVQRPSTQEEYLDAVGGVALLNRIQKWEQRG